MMLQQSTLMDVLVRTTKNSSGYIVVHDPQFDKRRLKMPSQQVMPDLAQACPREVIAYIK